MDGNAIRTHFPYPNTVLRLGSNSGPLANLSEPIAEGKNFRKKNPCTQKKRGNSNKKAKKKAQLGGHKSRRIPPKRFQKTKISLPHSRYAIAERKRKSPCPVHVRDIYLVELLRCKICTLVALVPLPTDRRRGRISLPLPLRRLRPLLRIEPRRRVWANGRSHVRITLAIGGRTWSLSKRQIRRKKKEGQQGRTRK